MTKLVKSTLIPDLKKSIGKFLSLINGKQLRRRWQNEQTLRDQLDKVRSQCNIARNQRDQARLKLATAREQRDKARASLDAALSMPTISHKGPDAYKVERARQEFLINNIENKDSFSSTQAELLMKRVIPPFLRVTPARETPGTNVGFATVANAKFVPGLEGLLLSLCDVYPDISSDFHVYHDGSLSAFVQARLRSIYPNLKFHVPDMGWLENLPTSSLNHKRIGVLGYMNIYAVLLDQYEHVVILDSDMIILDDISLFWKGEHPKVVYDCGARDYCVFSEYTRSFVFNSGAIGLPKSMLGSNSFEALKQAAIDFASLPVCSTLDRFSDQKIWNIYLGNMEKSYLPINYNCNIKYFMAQLGHFSEGISILHFAGPKPWNDQLYVNSSYLSEPPGKNAVHFPTAWLERYRNLQFQRRLQLYREWSPSRRESPIRNIDQENPTCLMIGNGPSLNDTDLSGLDEVEKFVFNWFVLSDRWESVCPDHLVLGSHMFFGGWNTQEPSFPENYLEKLYSRKHKPVIWSSFYFKEFFESIGLNNDFEINYLLFEKPFKRFVDQVGTYSCDVDGFRDDARTGVLTLGVPAAVSLGFKRVVLVGCDSNYNQSQGAPKYFYDMREHTSAETRQEILTNTWTEEGRGQHVYKLVWEALNREGVEFLDATIGGALTTVPKADISFLRASN